MESQEFYIALQEQLVEMKSNWVDNQGLDASYFSVSFPSSQWRLAKKCGAKKDYFYGWVLWRASVNSNSTKFRENIEEIVGENSGVYISERQL